MTKPPASIMVFLLILSLLLPFSCRKKKTGLEEPASLWKGKSILWRQTTETITFTEALKDSIKRSGQPAQRKGKISLPSTILKPGETYFSQTIFKFSIL